MLSEEDYHDLFAGIFDSASDIEIASSYSHYTKEGDGYLSRMDCMGYPRIHRFVKAVRKREAKIKLGILRDTIIALDRKEHSHSHV